MDLLPLLIAGRQEWSLAQATDQCSWWAYLIKEEQSLKDRSRLFILFLPTLVQGPSIRCLVSSSTWPEDVALSNGAMWMYLDSGGQTDRQTSWDHGDRWGYRALPRICPKWCSLDLPKCLVLVKFVLEEGNTGQDLFKQCFREVYHSFFLSKMCFTCLQKYSPVVLCS